MRPRVKPFHLIAALIAFTVIVLLQRVPDLAPQLPPSTGENQALTANTYRTSWIGNTFGGGKKWVQNYVNGLYVTPDGTLYTNSGWDEAGREAGIYKEGDVIGMAGTLHGWGRQGGSAVTATERYLFIAMQQSPSGRPGEDYPPQGTTWYCVRRYYLSGRPAPFATGRGWDKSMLIVNTSTQITGLAHQGGKLYVSDPATNHIRIYDSATMVPLNHFPVERPGPLTVDRQGNLWMIERSKGQGTAKILNYAQTGALLSKQIRDAVKPTALAVDPQGRLLVADNGPRQQILIYQITGTPQLVGTLGVKGGIYAGKRGTVGDLKLNGLTGVGADAAGNIYVSNSSAGTDLRKFSPRGELQWRLLGLAFLDSADADPATDGVDVFTKDEHFVMDYRQRGGQEWTYHAYTVDRLRYPDDARLHTLLTSPFLRRIGGKRFLFLTDQFASRLAIYRFDGEIAVPSALFARKPADWPQNQPQQGSWLWRDLNGDGSIQTREYERLGNADSAWGWEVDSSGDIWQISEAGSIKRYLYQGLDQYGSPVYTGTARTVTPMPAPFQQLLRLKYFPETDTMYLGGYTTERPQTGQEWGIVGTEIIRYDNWSTTAKIRWRIALPYNPEANPMVIIKAMDVVGNRVFAGDSRTAQIYVYDASTGALVTKLAPGPEVAQESGWLDIPYALRAFQHRNGEFLVLVEEVWKAKVMLYRLRG